jgi:hypothetical protein
MKNFTKLFLLFISIASFTNAQVTIQMADMPAAGSNYTMSNGITFTGIDVVGTGANYTWDFTQLGRSGQQIDSIISPAATNPLLNLFFFDYSGNVNRANLAQKGGSFNIGAIGATDAYNYYYNSSTSFQQPGIGAVVGGLPMPIDYTPNDSIYRFPLNFGDLDSCFFTDTINLISTFGFFYSASHTRHNEVDGWGTLMTPFGTFNTLRVKSTLIEVDSFYLDTINFGYKTPPTTTIEYKWLSPGMGLPVLQINTSATNTINSILYQDSTHTIGVDEIQAVISDAVVFPNPVTTRFFLKYKVLQKGDVTFELYSAEGRRVFSNTEENSAGEHFQSFDLNGYEISTGNYFLKIRSGESEIVRQVQIN